MVRGHLDSVTSAGYFEGWAEDSSRPTEIVPVAVANESGELANGLAHHFRRDLMEAGCGTGWCAFRIRSVVPPDQVGPGPYRLLNPTSGAVLHQIDTVPSIDDPEHPLETVEEVTEVDPTILHGVWQLRGCENLLKAFIRKRGVDAFVRAAYVYILQRPADDGGRVQYARSIRQSTLTPVGVLEVLANSEEFRNKARQLIAPNAHGFPFL